MTRAAPASASDAAFAPWWAPACGYGTIDRRDAEGGDLGQCRASRLGRRRDPSRPGPPACPRAGTATGRYRLATLGRQPLALSERGGVAALARHVQHMDALDEARQGAGDRGVETPDGLRAAEDEDRRRVRREVEPCPRLGSDDRRHVADRGSGDERRDAGRGEGPTGGRVDTASASASRAVARTARPGMALPSQRTTGIAERGGREEDRHRHVAAGRQDRRRPLGARGSPRPAGRTARAGSDRARC